VLRVLGVADVERLRERLRLAQSRHAGRAASGSQEGETATPAPEREILSLSIEELTKLGLVSMRGAAIAAVLVGLAWELGLFERLDLRGRLATIADVSPTWQIAFVAAVVVLSVPLLLVVVSIVWTIVRLYAFRLVEVEGSLRLTCGLLTRLTATVPRRRIQLISVIQTPVHRYFDRVSVRIETASGSAETEEKKIIGQRWFVPILPTARVGEILSELPPRRVCRDPGARRAVHAARPARHPPDRVGPFRRGHRSPARRADPECHLHPVRQGAVRLG
jgi:putative membrane protein